MTAAKGLGGRGMLYTRVVPASLRRNVRPEISMQNTKNSNGMCTMSGPSSRRSLAMLPAASAALVFLRTIWHRAMSSGAQTGVRTEGKDNGGSVVIAAATAVASTEAAGFLEGGVPESKAKGGVGDTLDNGGGGNDGSSKRLKGEVKGWNMERGFGFIKPINGGEDVFCHFSSITEGNVLREGDMVEYEAEYDDRKGKHSQRNRAIKVTGGKKVERS